MADWDIGYTLFVFVIILDIFLGLTLLKIRQSKNNERTKKYFIGMILFFLSHAVTRTIFLIYKFTGILELFYIGTALGLSSIVFIVFALELTILTETKRLFTIYGTIGVSLILIDTILKLNVGTMKLSIVVQYSVMPLLTVVVLFVYFKLAIKSRSKLRISAIMMIVAIIFFGLGESSNTNIAHSLFSWLNWGAPTFIIISLVCVFYSVNSFYAESKDH